MAKRQSQQTTKRKKVTYTRGLQESMKALQDGGYTGLFQPPTTRFIDTGLPMLNYLLGGNKHPGLPTGRWIEIIGNEGAGKSTLTYALAEAVIHQGNTCCHKIIENGEVCNVVPPKKVLVLDFEHATDVGYMAKAIDGCVFPELTVDGEIVNAEDATVWLHQPMTTEEGGDVMLHLLNSGAFGMVVVDSIPAMCAKEESEKPMDADTVGIQARAMGKLFRKAIGTVNRLGVVVVLVNQWRDKIGPSFGDPRHAPGGKAMKYYASIRLDVMGSRHTDWFPDDGKTCVIKALKNKVSGRCDVAEYHIQSGYGISGEVELIQAMMECGAMKYTPQKQVNPVQVVVNGRVAGFDSRQALITWMRDDRKRRAKLWGLVNELTSIEGP